jgi:uncharacterized membrane-anchored protein YitT (DUF2179 family)
MKENIISEIKNYLFIIIGSLILALSYALFIIPFHIVPGGVSGIAIILNFFFKTPVGIMTIVLNLPILYIGVKKLGRDYGIKSVVGIMLSYLTIDLFYELLGFKNIHATNNEILAAIYGGVLLGVGLGLVFKGRASTGGTDVIGMIINKYTGISIGMAILIIDSIIISGSGFAYKSLEAPLIGYLALFVSSKAIDFILEGWNYAKMAFIITDKDEKVRELIFETIKRSGTIFHGETLYKREDKNIIMTVITRKQFPTLRQEIRKIDPDAFVIITDVYEVLGKGFRKRI